MHIDMLKQTATLTALTLLLSGCIYYPKRSEDYDPDCQVNSMRLTLDSTALNLDCGSGDARACLAVITATGPATAVISGSIVVVGNTLHWLAKRGQCAWQSEKAPPPGH